MSNVNKPVIPAEVADVIEALREIPFYNNRDIINAYNSDPGRRVLRSIPFDTLLGALVNGYERELSEEQQGHEELKRAYLSGQGSRNWYHEGYADGIRFTVSTLGINIEGVNA